METVTLNKTQKERTKVLCAECKRSTNHEVILSADIDGRKDFDDDDWIAWDVHYQIIQCQGCDSLSFRRTDSNSEDYYPSLDSDSEWEPIVNEFLFPKRNSNTLAIKEFINSPLSLRRIYREVIESFNNEIYTLCGAGLRAIIDGLCIENNITDGPVTITKGDGTTAVKRKSNLEGQISGLHERGLLTSAHSAVLHEHRFMGNKAVHELEQPSIQELKIAIEIVEHTLENIYELPEKAKELRARKARRKGV